MGRFKVGDRVKLLAGTRWAVCGANPCIGSEWECEGVVDEVDQDKEVINFPLHVKWDNGRRGYYFEPDLVFVETKKGPYFHKEPRFHKSHGKLYEVHCECDCPDDNHVEFFNDGSIWDSKCPDCGTFFFWLKEDIEENLPSPKPLPPPMEAIRDLLPDVYGRKEWEKAFCRLRDEEYERRLYPITEEQATFMNKTLAKFVGPSILDEAAQKRLED